MKKAWVAAAIIVALSIDAAILCGVLGTTSVGTDFHVFWTASQRPVGELYPGLPLQPFVNPPTSLWMFAALGALPVVPSYLSWTGLNLVIFYAGMRRFFPIAAVAGAMISPVFAWAVFLGQSTPLLTGLLAFGLAVSPVAGGVLAAMVLLVKPQIAWLLPAALLLRGDHRRLVALVVALAAGILLSVALAGPRPWHDWIVSLPNFRDALFAQKVVLARTVSLSAQAQPLGPAASLIALVAAGIFVAFVVRRALPTSSPASVLTITVAASALAAPYALPHDIVALLPLAMIMLGSDNPVRRALGTLFLLSAALPALVAAYLLDSSVRRPSQPSG